MFRPPIFAIPRNMASHSRSPVAESKKDMVPTPSPSPEELATSPFSRPLDFLFRAGLLGALVVLCYMVFSPFLTLMAWAVVLAVALYPLHHWLTRKVTRKQGLAATILVIAIVLVIIVPTAILMSSFGDSVSRAIHSVEQNTVKIPQPSEKVKKVPYFGARIYSAWSKAYEDLPGLVESLQPEIGELKSKALSTVGRIGVDVIKFLASLVIAGIIMAYGESGSRGSQAIFVRILGPTKGEKMWTLSTATIRAVAQGILGVAFIQAIIIGLALLITGVPGAGILSIIAFVVGIVQVPTILVTLPAIAYFWGSGHYGTTVAVIYTLALLLAGMIDNVLKALFLGRGVEAPMPVVFLGALGGMATAGILGMFVGATLLTLGYQLFMGWVATPPAGTPEGVNVQAPASG
jgi:predicted PurR-regulated permease PerM